MRGIIVKVVAFSGSPRKNGNTVMLIEKVLDELEKEDIDTELIQLAG
ncbi:MAG: NAD(P)H-dependent oxidoreductase, partial [Halobacteriota archaeon]